MRSRNFAMAPISIHALREEGDEELTACIVRRDLFLSTPSARRATNSPQFTPFTTQISIHALREEGDIQPLANIGLIVISIHALREEGDKV